MRNVFILMGLVAALVLGALGARYYYASTQPQVTEQQQVLLERIKTVCKLVSVEGYFSEVYDYSDYRGYDFSFFRKKALIRVKAKVSAGYDLAKLSIRTDATTKTITVSNLPEPSIISIDHTLDYYDISEGTFNSFTPEEYTKLNARAKSFIEQQALKSSLMTSAKTEGNQMIDMMRIMAENSGWKFVIDAPAKIAN